MGADRRVAYRELADTIRAGIRSGSYPTNAALPTESQLSDRYGLSRTTVRRALQDLVSEGLIYRIPGKGTFPVASSERYLRQLGSIEDLMSLSVDTQCEIISPLQPMLDAESAAVLGLPEPEVMGLTLLRTFDSAPFSTTSVALPPQIGTLLASVEQLITKGATSNLTVIGSIEAAKPGLIVAAEQAISAVPAPGLVAERLNVPPGSPVMRVERVYTDRELTPVERAVSYFDPTQYTYRVKLRRQ